jgi:hypothetical protein
MERNGSTTVQASPLRSGWRNLNLVSRTDSADLQIQGLTATINLDLQLGWSATECKPKAAVLLCMVSVYESQLEQFY